MAGTSEGASMKISMTGLALASTAYLVLGMSPAAAEQKCTEALPAHIQYNIELRRALAIVSDNGNFRAATTALGSTDQTIAAKQSQEKAKKALRDYLSADEDLLYKIETCAR
jgi:hypothetical protein